MKRCFVDTNYFVRLVMRDEEAHFHTSKELFTQAASGTISLITTALVLFEVYWVLKGSVYEKNKRELIEVLRDILDMSFVEIDDRELFIDALDLYEKESISLEDCYNMIYAKRITVDAFSTFDKKLSMVFKKYR